MRTSEEIVDIMRKLGARDMISLHQNEPTYFLSGGGAYHWNKSTAK
jgi:hypothetical protein